jgi:hypothetical protein
MNMSHTTSRNECLLGSFPRPIDLLRRLASTRLPIHIADHGEIETLRILKLGGSIKAVIPESPRLPGGLHPSQGQAPATVDEITKLGRILLERFAKRRLPRHTRAQCL